MYGAPTIFTWIVAALIFGVPIGIVISYHSMEDREPRKKRPDDLTYDYDPKNWDTLNK